MEVLHYPNPLLRKRALPLEAFDQKVRDRAEEMFQVMYREGGVGLAATQVGWMGRLFVINLEGPDDTSGERVYVNPRILDARGEDVDEEGCLSIPEVRGRVKRHAALRVEARDLDGRVFQEELEGLAARAFQHELDHLDGILFIVRLGSAERLLLRKSLKRLEQEYRKQRKGLTARG
jgi:peptide deformylase